MVAKVSPRDAFERSDWHFGWHLGRILSMPIKIGWFVYVHCSMSHVRIIILNCAIHNILQQYSNNYSISNDGQN